MKELSVSNEIPDPAVEHHEGAPSDQEVFMELYAGIEKLVADAQEKGLSQSMTAEVLFMNTLSSSDGRFRKRIIAVTRDIENKEGKI